MPVSLSTLQNARAFKIEIETLGEIKIWALTLNVLRKFREGILKKDLKTGKSKIILFISLIGTYINPSDEKNFGKQIALRDLKNVSNAELNTFAELFLKKHPELVQDSSKGSEQKEDFHTEDSQRVDTPKKPGEETHEYLARVLDEYENHFVVQTPMVLGGIPASEYLTKLEQNSALSRLMKEGLNNLQIPSVEVRALRPDLAHSPSAKLDEVVNALSSLAGLTKQSVTLVDSLNDLGREMAVDFEKNAKQTQKLTYFALCLAIASLVIGTIFSALNSYEGRYSSKKSEELLNSLSEESNSLKNDQRRIFDAKLLKIQTLLAKESQILLDLEDSNIGTPRNEALRKQLADVNGQIQSELEVSNSGGSQPIR